MGRVSGSPKRSMPTHMAVMGSKAPSTAAIVLLICFKAMISVTLLTAVGTTPNKKRLTSWLRVSIGSMRPRVKVA